MGGAGERAKLYAAEFLRTRQTPAQEYLGRAIDETAKEVSTVVETVRGHLEAEGVAFEGDDLKARVVERLAGKRDEDARCVLGWVATAWEIGFHAGIEEARKRGRR